MRKVEIQMNHAIRYRRNWASSNTMVRVSREVIEVFLHGNHIASVDTATNNLTLFDGGWQSNTTKSSFFEKFPYLEQTHLIEHLIWT